MVYQNKTANHKKNIISLSLFFIQVLHLKPKYCNIEKTHISFPYTGLFKK